MKFILKTLLASTFVLGATSALADCEIFVDKTVTQAEEHYAPGYGRNEGYRHVQIFIKVDQSRLDAPVSYVAWEGVSADPGWDRNGPVPVSYRLEPFANSLDYFAGEFQQTIAYSHYGTHLYVHSGRFYVVTTTGTRYFAKSSVGDFVIDDRLAQSLPAVDMGQALKTADLGVVGTYLNPDHCR